MQMCELCTLVFCVVIITHLCLNSQEDAFDEKGDFRQDRLSSINKVGTLLRTVDGMRLELTSALGVQVGHALHDLNPVFREVTYTQQVGEIARYLLPVHHYLCRRYLSIQMTHEHALFDAYAGLLEGWTRRWAASPCTSSSSPGSAAKSAHTR